MGSCGSRVIAKERECAGNLEIGGNMGATGSLESEHLSKWALGRSVHLFLASFHPAVQEQIKE